MLNQTVLVGRISEDPTVSQLENDKRVSVITLAIPRSFKNAEGEYDTDFVDCTLWNGVADNVKEYCHKGDLVGIKGRIQSTPERVIEIIAEKVTFLSSKVRQEDID